MEDEIKKSKLETLSKMIKRKDLRIKMLSKISRNSTLIRLNSLVRAQERNFQLDKSTSNFQMKSEEFVSDLIDLLINSVIKVEPPAPTPKATNDEIPLFEEICKNFGLNDVDLDYSDADYQNLTTYKMFQQAYRSRNQSANPKVSCQAARAEAPEAEEDLEEKIESEIRSDFQINNYIKTLLLSLLKTELAEESEEKKCLPVPEMTVELDDTPRYLTRLEIRKRLAHEKGRKC